MAQVTELRAELAARGLKVSGVKAVLQERLLEGVNSQRPVDSAMESQATAGSAAEDADNSVPLPSKSEADAGVEVAMGPEDELAAAVAAALGQGGEDADGDVPTKARVKGDLGASPASSSSAAANEMGNGEGGEGGGAETGGAEVFVRGLPFEMSSAQLLQHFSTFGEVRSVRGAVTQLVPLQMSGQAWVRFNDPAQAALTFSNSAAKPRDTPNPRGSTQIPPRDHRETTQIPPKCHPDPQIPLRSHSDPICGRLLRRLQPSINPKWAGGTLRCTRPVAGHRGRQRGSSRCDCSRRHSSEPGRSKGLVRGWR